MILEAEKSKTKELTSGGGFYDYSHCDRRTSDCTQDRRNEGKFVTSLLYPLSSHRPFQRPLSHGLVTSKSPTSQYPLYW